MQRNGKGQYVKGANLKDLTGNHYGMLTVINNEGQMGSRQYYWLCKCDCGREKTIRGDSLVGGKVRSCGCIKEKQDIINLEITNNHKQTYHPLYGRWNDMKNRCENPRNPSYRYYGARGISICDEWHDINKFIEWAESNGYKKGLTIDRIDVNGNYEPGNCRWIPLIDQSYNKTDSVYHTYNGETLTTMQWVHRYNIPQWRASSYRKDGIDFIDIIKKYEAKATPR